MTIRSTFTFSLALVLGISCLGQAQFNQPPQNGNGWQQTPQQGQPRQQQPRQQPSQQPKQQPSQQPSQQPKQQPNQQPKQQPKQEPKQQPKQQPRQEQPRQEQPRQQQPHQDPKRESPSSKPGAPASQWQPNKPTAPAPRGNGDEHSDWRRVYDGHRYEAGYIDDCFQVEVRCGKKVKVYLPEDTSTGREWVPQYEAQCCKVKIDHARRGWFSSERDAEIKIYGQAPGHSVVELVMVDRSKWEQGREAPHRVVKVFVNVVP